MSFSGQGRGGSHDQGNRPIFSPLTEFTQSQPAPLPAGRVPIHLAAVIPHPSPFAGYRTSGNCRLAALTMFSTRAATQYYGQATSAEPFVIRAGDTDSIRCVLEWIDRSYAVATSGRSDGRAQAFIAEDWDPEFFLDVWAVARDMAIPQAAEKLRLQWHQYVRLRNMRELTQAYSKSEKDNNAIARTRAFKEIEARVESDEVISLPTMTALWNTIGRGAVSCRAAKRVGARLADQKNNDTQVNPSLAEIEREVPDLYREIQKGWKP